MDRRRFLLTSVAGALAAPLSAEAQSGTKVLRVGLLSGGVPRSTPSYQAFEGTLRSLGYVAQAGEARCRAVVKQAIGRRRRGQDVVVDRVSASEQVVGGQEDPLGERPDGQPVQGDSTASGALLVPLLSTIKPGAGSGRAKSDGETRNDLPPRTTSVLPLNSVAVR